MAGAGDGLAARIPQRRDWFRVDAVRPVRVAAAGRVAHTHTTNVSAGGILVCDPLGLSVGEQVALALALVDGEAWLEAPGIVAGVRPAEERAAIAFAAIAEADRERIVRWAVERQRDALRLRSGA